MSFIYGFAIERGAHSVLKGRILPRTMSTEAKMRAQNEQWALGFHFLREYIDKIRNKVHNKLTSKYQHISEHGFALRREVQRNGV